ncbi:hypothetical protein GDO78_013728 [Eleutherodactylus coqui]|uniref:Uncharacterized protein n=1 Tax=Eleutherodactylus coqui TaxID=57060 RepID=A0A8J6ELS9_ELECQ|nr:hypothetical protein GDO78_013728 [Eleutherodactylus coqui]
MGWPIDFSYFYLWTLICKACKYPDVFTVIHYSIKRKVAKVLCAAMLLAYNMTTMQAVKMSPAEYKILLPIHSKGLKVEQVLHLCGDFVSHRVLPVLKAICHQFFTALIETTIWYCLSH